MVLCTFFRHLSHQRSAKAQARGLISGLSLPLLPYLVYARSQGSKLARLLVIVGSPEVGKVSTNFAAAKNGKVGSNYSAVKNGQVSSSSKKR